MEVRVKDQVEPTNPEAKTEEADQKDKKPYQKPALAEAKKLRGFLLN
jgi:hypothetical protein